MCKQTNKIKKNICKLYKIYITLSVWCWWNVMECLLQIWNNVIIVDLRLFSRQSKCTSFFSGSTLQLLKPLTTHCCSNIAALLVASKTSKQWQNQPKIQLVLHSLVLYFTDLRSPEWGMLGIVLILTSEGFGVKAMPPMRQLLTLLSRLL